MEVKENGHISSVYDIMYTPRFWSSAEDDIVNTRFPPGRSL